MELAHAGGVATQTVFEVRRGDRIDDASLAFAHAWRLGDAQLERLRKAAHDAVKTGAVVPSAVAVVRSSCGGVLGRPTCFSAASRSRTAPARSPRSFLTRATRCSVAGVGCFPSFDTRRGSSSSGSPQRGVFLPLWKSMPSRARSCFAGGALATRADMLNGLPGRPDAPG